jgi:hypothetical protein
MRASSGCVVAFLGGILWLGSIERAAAATLTVALEVTQGIQYFENPTHGTNTIPLVAQRPTVVRARVKGLPALTVVQSVDGKLELLPAPTPPVVVGPFNKSGFKTFLGGTVAWDRNVADHTLNFKLDADDLQPGAWDFKVTVDVTEMGGAVHSGNSTAHLDAVKLRSMEVRLVPLEFELQSSTLGPPNSSELQGAVHLVEACFPLPFPAKLSWGAAVQVPKRKDNRCPGAIDDQGKASEVEKILTALEDMRLFMVKNGIADPDLICYGFEATGHPSIRTRISDKGCGDILGWSKCAERAGFGTADIGLAGKVLCHEMGHMLGLSHCAPECTDGTTLCAVDPEVGWDVMGGMGGSTVSSATSFMMCGLPTTEIWARPEDFKHCIEVLKEGSMIVPCGSSSEMMHDPVAGNLVVNGGVSADGHVLEWLDPMFRYPWKIAPTPVPAAAPYEILAFDGAGHVIGRRRFDVRMHVESLDGSTAIQRGCFSVVVAVPPQEVVEKVKIRRITTVLKTVDRTAVAPQIEITSHQNGITLNQPTVIHWKTTDSDTDPTEILYHVGYSPDGGHSFEPVDVDLEDRRVQFRPAVLPPSEPGKGLVRIFASDGLNTTFVDLSNLTVQPQ